jgi:23S rRNA pseudouridine2605 synthase
MRIQKFLSTSGTASRREAEKLILDGRVSVNGKVVKELWTQIDPEKDIVRLDNRPVGKQEERITIILYKPRGYVTTLKDEKGRSSVSDLIKSIPVRLFPVGRLDLNTDGLLILTNDGELSQKISHPRYGLEKTYLAKVSGIPEQKTLKRLEKGIVLDGEKTLPAALSMGKRLENSCYIEITIKEGKNRQVRRMFEAVGHPVRKLRRVRIGPLTLRDMKPGEYRFLSGRELKAFKKEIDKNLPDKLKD